MCKSFNSKKGCTYQGCKFRHACILPECIEAHSATVHYAGKKLDFQVKPSPGRSLAAWDQELYDDLDRDFILSGIRNGP